MENPMSSGKTSSEQVWCAWMGLTVTYGAVCGAILGSFLQWGVGTIIGAIIGAIGGGVAALIGSPTTRPGLWGLAGAVGAATSGLITLMVFPPEHPGVLVAGLGVPALIGGGLGVGVARGVRRGSSWLPGVRRLAALLRETTSEGHPGLRRSWV